MGKKSKKPQGPTPREILETALASQCYDHMALVIGRNKFGEISIISSHDSLHAVYLMEAAKLMMLRGDACLDESVTPDPEKIH